MKPRLRSLSLLIVAVLLSLGGRGSAEEPSLPRPGTWIGRAVTGGGREAFATNPILAEFLRDESFRPKENEDGWARLAADGDSVNPPFANGYAFTTIASEKDQVVMLRGAGHAWAALSGTPLAGDIYRNGTLALPVALRKGENPLLVRVARGAFSLSLERAPLGVDVDPLDATLPDLRAGEPLDAWAQVVLVNPTASTVSGIELVSEGGPFARTRTPVPPIEPLTVTKAAMRIVTRETVAGVSSVALSVFARVEGHAEAPPRREFALRVRAKGESWKETFRSEIDGSIQYFAVRAPRKVEKDKRYGLVLTLHGASVEASGQVDAYTTKEWCYTVAPTNRRPFGFDWEDWGRDDALEVLQVAQERFAIDPLRVHLAGHSMGGHGTWHVGATFPGRFASIAPSAGWISFMSYAGLVPPGASSSRNEIFARALGPSDTLSLVENLRDLGVFVIHGEKDDNVPVSESRKIVGELRRFHQDLRYHEEPLAGHWWSKVGPGADCVDLPDLMSFLSRRSRNETPRSVSWRTWNPGISSRSGWVEIERQEKHLALSRVEANVLPGAKKVKLETENVACLALDLSPFLEAGSLEATIDGTACPLEWDGKKPLRLERSEKKWRLAAPRDPLSKNPARYGPFKRALSHRFVLVYGTGGSEAENRAAYDKARFDAQTWSYRANGAALVMPDRSFEPEAFPDRGVVLYGHREMNTAFDLVLENPAVKVERGRVSLGEKTFPGDDKACLVALPRKGSERAMVAVVGGTGAPGLRLTLATPYLSSGVAYPDFCVFDSKVLAGGLPAVLACGILDDRFSLEHAFVDTGP